jgi:oligopeptide/dipeptide ABC transporter ATP-binding protein
MRQLPSPPGRIDSGKILFDGVNLLDLPKSKMRSIRGESIAMIFQEPMTSLNPVMTVGRQVAEAVQAHQNVSHAEAWDKAVDMLRLVKIPMPEKRAKSYPHQLSGGMRQRAMIAIALACQPKLLICDEPTTALDVTVQAQVLKLIIDLQKQLGMAVMLITHDLGVISQMADNVAVMYAGQIVETGSCEHILAAPAHPYTRALLESAPSLRENESGEKKPLYVIRGMVPGALERPKGCLFASRCDYAGARCFAERPPAVNQSDGLARCFMYTEEGCGERGL